MEEGGREQKEEAGSPRRNAVESDLGLSFPADGTGTNACQSMGVPPQGHHAHCRFSCLFSIHYSEIAGLDNSILFKLLEQKLMKKFQFLIKMPVASFFGSGLLTLRSSNRV